MSFLGLAFRRTESATLNRPAAASSITQCAPPAAVRMITKAGISRPAPIDWEVSQFLVWLKDEGITGEHLWRDLWLLYQNKFAVENDIEPVPTRKKAYFAQALAAKAKRSQLRILEDGRLRRLTTYTLPELSAEWV